jgi:hypothetical protein
MKLIAAVTLARFYGTLSEFRKRLPEHGNTPTGCFRFPVFRYRAAV